MKLSKAYKDLLKKESAARKGLYNLYSGDFNEGAKYVLDKITPEIALAFLDYYSKTVPLSFTSTGENNGLSKEKIWEKFLKTYKK